MPDIDKFKGCLLGLYPYHLKMQDSVGIKIDLDKALVVDKGGSLIKINNAV